MNLHIPQSVQTANELKMLTLVPTQIISPRESKPIISIVQDVTLGVYRITQEHVRVTEKQLMNLVMSNTKFSGDLPKPHEIIDGIPLWNGRQLLSLCLPGNININMANKQYDDRDPDSKKKNIVVVEHGDIKQGVFDKTIYQTRTSGLVHSVYNENGEEETKQLFDNTQKLICDWLVYSGFSVGVSDLVVDQATSDEMDKKISDMKKAVYDIIRDLHTGKFENKSINSRSEYFEQEVNKLLNQAINDVGKIGLSMISDLNRMINMINSGSKGSAINVAQMISSLGQQNVDGKRIQYGYDDRTLPHFTKYDDGPESRGFVENSFIKGLSPSEFFLHAIGGYLAAAKREQLSRKALL